MSTTKKKKPEHYVNNKEFYAAMVEYKIICRAAEEAGKEQPRIPEYLGMCIYKIATKLSNRPNFINYSYKDEMIGDGIENAILNIRSFNPDKYDNPFAYFTQCIFNSFVQRINKEKKQQYVKYKSLENAIISNDQFVFQDADDKIITGGYNEAAINAISSFENIMQKKKDATKEKKALENFIEAEEQMFTNLPPAVQDLLTNLNNRAAPINIRFNYFSMLNNISSEIKKETDKFQRELDKQRK